MEINQYPVENNYPTRGLQKLTFRRIQTLLICLCLILTGCDSIYRILQKEGAEEKDLFGEVMPFESNRKVEYLQKLLKLYGYNPGLVDGKFGVNTRRAIEKFQKDNHLPAHRFVDRLTWKQLNIFISTGLVVKAEPNITKVQRALRAAGWNIGKIDGKMGKKTEEALKEFQKKQGLLPDGRMGYKTLTQLARYLQSGASVH